MRTLEQVVDWEKFTSKLVPIYRGRANIVRPPYDPVLILKMLVLPYLQYLSERQVKVYVDDGLSAK